jgi:hypothetical protein
LGEESQAEGDFTDEFIDDEEFEDEDNDNEE